IWKKANTLLEGDELTTHGILKKFQVTTVCTTDDPTDDLKPHQTIAASGLATRVLPAFRPDKALNVHQPGPFNEWVNRLGAMANVDVKNLDMFLDALRTRHDFFHSIG